MLDEDIRFYNGGYCSQKVMENDEVLVHLGGSGSTASKPSINVASVTLKEIGVRVLGANDFSQLIADDKENGYKNAGRIAMKYLLENITPSKMFSLISNIRKNTGNAFYEKGKSDAQSDVRKALEIKDEE